MKTLRTIAAILLAAFMVLAPVVAFAAGETVTVATNATSYSGASTIQVTGTVTPAPTSTNTAVVVTTKGPAGVVDTGTVPVATGTGAYAYTFVAGGSPMWTSGTYVVNATYGGPGGTGSATASFAYTAGGTGGGGPQGINVQVTASGPTPAGAQEYVAILTSFQANGSLAAATFQTVHYHTPAGTLVTLCSSSPCAAGTTGTFTTIHKGFYEINFTAPSAVGGYFVHAWTNGPVANGVSTGQGQGLAEFTVAAAGGTTGSTTTTTVTTTVPSSDASALAAIQTQLNTINSAVGGISGLQTSVNGISQSVTGLTTTLTGLQNSLTSIGNISGQLTSLTNSVNNNQTYVLVVAALAAITLVLELAILVRKLS